MNRLENDETVMDDYFQSLDLKRAKSFFHEKAHENIIKDNFYLLLKQQAEDSLLLFLNKDLTPPEGWNDQAKHELSKGSSKQGEALINKETSLGSDASWIIREQSNYSTYPNQNAACCLLS